MPQAATASQSTSGAARGSKSQQYHLSNDAGWIEKKFRSHVVNASYQARREIDCQVKSAKMLSQGELLKLCPSTYKLLSNFVADHLMDSYGPDRLNQGVAIPASLVLPLPDQSRLRLKIDPSTGSFSVQFGVKF
jgi:hypothetical protein